MVTRLKNLFSKKEPASSGRSLSAKPRRFDSVQSASKLKEIASSYPFLFLGFELNLPIWARPGQNVVAHNLSNSFEFLAHVALQARVQGKRVVWVSPGHVDTDFEVINELCKSPLNLRDFEFHNPGEQAFIHSLVRSAEPNNASSNAGLIVCEQQVIHHPGESRCFENLAARFCSEIAQAQGEAADTGPAMAPSSKSCPLANTLFLFQDLPLSAFHVEHYRFNPVRKNTEPSVQNSDWLQELEGFGASWVVATSNDLPLDSPLLAVAKIQLNAQSSTVVTLDTESGRGPHNSMSRLVNRKGIPQSVWSVGRNTPLFWLLEGLEKQGALLNTLHMYSTALNEILNPALEVKPEFRLGAGAQTWYYNTAGEKVLMNTAQMREPLNESIHEIAGLLAWAFDFEKRLATTGLAHDPQFETFIVDRLSFVSRSFESEIAKRSEITSVFSFDTLCEVFAHALNEESASRSSSQPPAVSPAFEALPVRLRTLFWLEAYRRARPNFNRGAHQLALTYSSTAYPGVLGVPIPEDLDLLALLSSDERRVWAHYFRRSRRATFSFFMSDKTNYTEILSRYRAGETVPGSLFEEILMIFDGLYGARPQS